MATRPTEKFLAALHVSHEAFSYVELHSPDGDIEILPAVGGDIKVDRTAAVRRGITVELVDPDGTLVPEGVNSVLTPFGAELHPFRGIRYDDGTTEVYPLGVFRISKVSVKDTSGGSPTITVDGYDRSRTVARDKFTSVYTITQGTNLIDAIKDIVERTFSEVDYDLTTTTITTTAPKVYDANDDPWTAVTELAQSMGCDIYFDAEGALAIVPPVDIDDLPNPDFSYVEGDGNTMTDISRVYSDEPGYNGVIVVGESVGDEKPPVRGEAWDEEPTSVTYRFGPYGEVPLFVTDSNVKTDVDAEQAAKHMLSNLLGFSQQLDVQATVNPTYEAGQVVQVTRARSHVDDLFVVDAFNIPLRASGAQGLILRQKRSAI